MLRGNNLEEILIRAKTVYELTGDIKLSIEIDGVVWELTDQAAFEDTLDMWKPDNKSSII